MPKLNWDDEHKCPMCTYSSRRNDLKRHLTSVGKKGPRCAGLKKVLSTDEWNQKILPHFRDNAGLQELPSYKLKSPRGKRKRKPIKEIPRQDRHKRLSRDGFIDETGDCKFSEGELLEMLWSLSGVDGRPLGGNSRQIRGSLSLRRDWPQIRWSLFLRRDRHQIRYSLSLRRDRQQIRWSLSLRRDRQQIRWSISLKHELNDIG